MDSPFDPAQQLNVPSRGLETAAHTDDICGRCNRSVGIAVLSTTPRQHRETLRAWHRKLKHLALGCIVRNTARYRTPRSHGVVGDGALRLRTCSLVQYVAHLTPCDGYNPTVELAEVLSGLVPSLPVLSFCLTITASLPSP